MGFISNCLGRYLWVFLLAASPVFSQALWVINPKGRVSFVAHQSDILQIVYATPTGSNITYSGQLTALTADSISLRGTLPENQRIALGQLKGVRRLPSLVTSLAAGMAMGATGLTIWDKRELSSGPRIGLSLLIGAGTGIAYRHLVSHRKRIRQRTQKGWTFQIR